MQGRNFLSTTAWFFSSILFFGVKFQLQTKRQLCDKGPEYWAFFMFCLLTEILFNCHKSWISFSSNNYNSFYWNYHQQLYKVFQYILKTVWKSSLLKLAGIIKQNLNMGYSGRLQLNCVNIYILCQKTTLLNETKWDSGQREQAPNLQS